MKDLIEIVKSPEDSGLLLKGVSETIQNEAIEQKGGCLSMLLGTLGVNLLGNILTGWGAIAKSVGEETNSKRQGRRMNRAGEGAIAKSVSEETKLKGQGRRIVRAGYGNKKEKWKDNNKKQKEISMSPHPLTSFEIQKYYQNQTRFNGAYFKDNLSKIKDGAYVINLD